MDYNKYISRENPLLILGFDSNPSEGHEANARKMVEAYRMLPHEKIPQAVMCFGDCQADVMEVYAQAAQKAGIPLMVQTRTWFPCWDERFREHTMPVSDFLKLADKYSCIVGAQIVELNCFGLSTEEKIYVSELLEGCAKRELFVSWQEANDGCNVFVDACIDKDFFETIKKYGKWLFPQWEMNIPRSCYLTQGALLGMWMTDVVENWGVEAQSFYWSDCGYTKLNTREELFDLGYRKSRQNMCPPSFWGQMLMMGLSAGATVYSLEPTHGVVWNDDFTALHSTFTDVIAPFFETMKQFGIPTKKAVREKMKLAYHADFESSYDNQVSDVDYFRGDNCDYFHNGHQQHRGMGSGLFWRGTYGIRDSRDMIPKTGRYYWLPVLPKYTSYEYMKDFRRVVPPNNFYLESEVTMLANSLYPVDAIHGDGFCVEVDGCLYGTNTHENMDIRENISIDFSQMPMDRMTVLLEPQQYFLGRQQDACLSLHCNGYQDRATQIMISANQDLRIEICSYEKGTDINAAQVVTTDSEYAEYSGNIVKLSKGVTQIKFTNPLFIKIY